MSNLPINRVLEDLARGHPLTDEQFQQLLNPNKLNQKLNQNNPEANSLQTQTALEMFCLGADPRLLVQQQAEFFLNHYPEFEVFCHDRLGLYQHIADHLWFFWLPLAHGLKRQREQNQAPWIQGLVGLQGTGKTTLTKILTWILHQWGYRCLCLSLDDLYLPYSDRVQLQRENPDLIWRGPPGTHDVELGLAVLTALQAQTEHSGVWVPRFDKSLHGGAGDRVAPEWISTPVDIVLFEGWFVGMAPHPLVDALPSPLTQSPLTQYCNQQLHRYVPLWNLLNALLILHLPQRHCSKLWRKEAEQKMNPQGTLGQVGMTDNEIDRFVDYFWEALPPDLFLDRLTKIPCPTQLVELQADRSIPRFLTLTPNPSP